MKKFIILLFFLQGFTTVFGAKAVINKTWIEYGVLYNNEEGVYLHTNFTVNNMKGKEIRVVFYFYNSRKQKLLGGIAGYNTSEGQVSISETNTPNFDNTLYKDFKIFIPYRALPLKAGKNSWFVKAAIYDEGSKKFLDNNQRYATFIRTVTSKQTAQNTKSNLSNQNSNQLNYSSKMAASSLSYKRWETKFDKGHTEFVRESNGMVTETMYLNCVCLNGICKICAGLGVTGYGMFQTYCSSCGGTAKCSFCGGTGTKVTTYRYRFIDEYYSNGTSALHVTSSNSGPSVYIGGSGYAYNTYGNSKAIKDEGSYYSFGGEIVYGVKTTSFRLSKDYKTLWMGNNEYHLIDKAEYDRIAEITSKVLGGGLAIPSSSPSTGSGSYSSGSSSSSSSSRSIYTKCTDCNGTGRCRHCNGTGTSNLSAHTEICVVCNGNGKCKICFGRGKL